MGTCHNCNTQVTLKDGESKCDNCKEVLRYCCHQCNNWFFIRDQNQNKLKECKVCGFFYCPLCGICGPDCAKSIWRERLNTINPKLQATQISDVIKLLEEIKYGKENVNCLNLVPITYAKTKIKSLFARMDGFKTKSEKDTEAFKRRVMDILDKPLGWKMNVNELRENGSYGQEYRDALNIGICTGEIKANIIRKEDGRKYIEYERIQEPPCNYLVKIGDLIINHCSKCQSVFEKEELFCNRCVYKKGKNKGQPLKLKKRLSNIDSCKFPRNDFKKIKDEVGYWCEQI